MLLAEARRPARVSPSGELVTLDRQDRAAWHRDLIDEGHALVRERAATGEAPGRFQLLAAMSAVHTAASTARETDWPRIVALDPSPIVRLNRAVAIGEVHGPGAALAEVDRVAVEIDGYHALHATRADLLRRLGRRDEARAAYDRALELTSNAAERAYLARRRDELDE